MRLLARHDLRPDTSLGQHFLLDENLVDVSVRDACVGPEDVVLEVGAGVGVLTVALARAAAHVHAVEVDRRLEAALTESLAPYPNVRVHWADAARLDMEALDPAPTKLVANLPYSIATPIVADSTWRLPGLVRWSVMVQREVAERWVAAPGGREYGAPSVVVQHATRQIARRAVPREAFVPRPRVESSLVVLERTGPGAGPALRRLVRAAFAGRRKTLANSLSAAGYERAAVLAALDRMGRPPAARPETLSPEEYAVLAEALA
jgi:16S rRNA (adenine1518-N6/adenine1519-N6)-dimethyltransferase